ncbi:MAG TPA: hypothetical protein VGM87_05585 [Roseomonas sp.]|jgi:hypothetical protein
MSGDFGSLGLDPEMMRRLLEQWQVGAAIAPDGTGAMMQPDPAADFAKMGAPPMAAAPAADPATLGKPNALAAPAGSGLPKPTGYVPGQQPTGVTDVMARLGLGGGGSKNGQPQGGGITGLLRGASGLARPNSAGGQAMPMSAGQPPGNRPRGGGALPMREFVPGNPYLKRRKGLLDDE